MVWLGYQNNFYFQDKSEDSEERRIRKQKKKQEREKHKEESDHKIREEKKWREEIVRKIQIEAVDKVNLLKIDFLEKIYNIFLKGIDLTPDQLEKVCERRMKKLRKKMDEKKKEKEREGEIKPEKPHKVYLKWLFKVWVTY